jgi:integrase/recombinase XerD
VTAIAATLQAFFTDRLISQRRASPHTITAYRDTLRLLVTFAATRTGTPPCRLDIADLDAPMISAFLNHAERERGNSIRTRNARLAAIHSLFGFAALRHPEHAADIARVLAIRPKRADQTIVTFLTAPEADALLSAPDRATRTGRRDHAWILLAIQTGLRASELTALTCGDVHLGAGAYVACHGKGRKDRITPLAPATVTTLRAWLAERGGTPDAPLFVTSRCGPMSRDALQQRLSLYTATAAVVLPVPGQQKRHSPRLAALGRHGIAARRGRYHRHRLVARPRIGHHHADLPASRHGAQAASPRPDHAARYRPGPIPAPRPAPGLPRSTVIMPAQRARSPPPACTSAPVSA